MLPAIYGMMGLSLARQLVETTISKNYTKPEQLTCLVKGYFNGRMVIPLDAQESFRLRSFAVANALILLEEGKTHYLEGDPVTIQLLPIG